MTELSVSLALLQWRKATESLYYLRDIRDPFSGRLVTPRLHDDNRGESLILPPDNAFVCVDISCPDAPWSLVELKACFAATLTSCSF